MFSYLRKRFRENASKRILTRNRKSYNHFCSQAFFLQCFGIFGVVIMLYEKLNHIDFFKVSWLHVTLNFYTFISSLAFANTSIAYFLYATVHLRVFLYYCCGTILLVSNFFPLILSYILFVVFDVPIIACALVLQHLHKDA